MTITLITGANKGLGCETARRLIELGRAVLAGARDRQRGSKAAHELGAIFINLDPTDDDSLEAAAAWVRSEYGHLDILINNAGNAAPRGPRSLVDQDQTDDAEPAVTDPFETIKITDGGDVRSRSPAKTRCQAAARSLQARVTACAARLGSGP